MSFRITGLSPIPFRHLFGLPDEALQTHGALRYVVDEKPGYPDRITLCDAEPGETVLLLNYVHQPAANPYHASHAIFLREKAEAAYDRVDEIPEAFRSRLMSLRAFDAGNFMIDADVCEGCDLKPAVERLLSNPDVSYIQAHYAKRGCYAARIERVVL